jgi:predicted ester cyclase
MGNVAGKEVVKRLFKAFDAVDFETIDELLSPDFVAHGLAPQFSENVAGWKALAAHRAAGFSEEVLTFDDLIAEDGKVAVRWTSRAVHIGGVFGIAATGRWVTVSGIGIYRRTTASSWPTRAPSVTAGLHSGRVIEYWASSTSPTCLPSTCRTLL